MRRDISQPIARMSAGKRRPQEDGKLAGDLAVRHVTRRAEPAARGDRRPYSYFTSIE